jgi:hypothetical protein
MNPFPYPPLEKAIMMAIRAHRGQLDRAGQPYVLHALRVMIGQQTESARIVGVLHDILENTAVTLDILREAEFSDEVCAALDCLTRRVGERYHDYIDRIIGNSLACHVKFADLAGNLDPARLLASDESDLRRLARYKDAWNRITGRLHEDGHLDRSLQL